MDELLSQLPYIDQFAAVSFIVISFFTSALTAAFGIGGGVILLIIMGYFLPIAAAIPIHGFVQFGSNAGRTFLLRKFIVWNKLLPFLFGSVFGAWLGVDLVQIIPDWILKLILGAFTIIFTWIKIPRLAEIGHTGLVFFGLSTTFLSMFIGASGPLNLSVLEKIIKARQSLIASTGAVMTIQHFLKISVFWLSGFAFYTWMPLIIAMMVSGFAGTYFGIKFLHIIPENIFRKYLKIALTIISLDLIRRALTLYFS